MANHHGLYEEYPFVLHLARKRTDLYDSFSGDHILEDSILEFPGGERWQKIYEGKYGKFDVEFVGFTFPGLDVKVEGNNIKYNGRHFCKSEGKRLSSEFPDIWSLLNLFGASGGG